MLRMPRPRIPGKYTLETPPVCPDGSLVRGHRHIHAGHDKTAHTHVKCASGRVSGPPRLNLLVVVADPGGHGADLVPFLSLGLCAPRTNTGISGKECPPTPPSKLFRWFLGQHMRGPSHSLSTFPNVWVLLPYAAWYPWHVTVLSLLHTPPPPVCAHVSLGQKYRTGLRNTASGLGPQSLTSCVTLGKSLSTQASLCFLLVPARGLPVEMLCMRMCVRYVYAHGYAQTVHTCASHENMFILYMDVQTCMARKTPSLHVHRMGAFTQWM